MRRLFDKCRDWTRAQARHARPSALFPRTEGLEARQLLAATSAVILSAAPSGGQGVEVSYRVDGPLDRLEVGVYRSADDRLDDGDLLVGLAGLDASAGEHAATVVLDGGLAPVPERPFVIVADASATAEAASTASFRVHSVVIVVHGGTQNPKWKNGPPWQLIMARTLMDEGYDKSIPFNWAHASRTPGKAAEQGLRLAATIKDAASAFPPGAPVDLHVIAHSEGAVVLTQALRLLGPELTDELVAGFLKVTLLDPYSASNGFPGEDANFIGGPLGWLGIAIGEGYKARADDPPVIVPPWVDGTEAFYQQTPARLDHGTNYHLYNLWGQVPVRGVSTYFDLTPASVTHSGKTGVAEWYQRHIVPTLGDGAPEVASAVLTLAADGPNFGGRSAPGSTVRVLAAPADDPTALFLAGRTEAAPDGSWSLPNDLPTGHYRIVARAAPAPAPWLSRIPMVSTATLGTKPLTVLGS